MFQHKHYVVICILLVFSIFTTSCGSSADDMSYIPEPVTRDDIKFSELQFYLPEAGELKSLTQAFVSNMEKASSAKEQISLVENIDREWRRYTDMSSIASIRFYQNVNDEKAKSDYEYFSQFFSDVSEDNDMLYAAIVQSEYIDDLEAYFGKNAIDICRNYMSSSDSARIEVGGKIDDLETQYIQLSTNNLAHRTLFKNESDRIFNEILPLRKSMAELAGYENYFEYEYSNVFLTVSDVKNYIENIKQTLLPIHQKLADSVVTGTADRCPASKLVKLIPSTPEDEIELSFQVLRSTLDEMSPMLNYIQLNEMLSLMPDGNKRPFNATFLLKGVQTPFVFMTTPNANMIFHEFGHALEFYQFPKIDFLWRYNSTPMIAEVSSICMEVLATTQYEIIYGDTAGYARMKKVYDLTRDLLWNTLLSEFELVLYEKPEMTQSEREDLFSDLLEEYRFSSGSEWTRIGSFFTFPTYTINYSLDDVVALELWRVMQDDISRAKEMYLNYLCDNTQQDYVMRLENAGLSNPFERQNLEELAYFLDDLFNSEEYRNPKN